MDQNDLKEVFPMLEGKNVNLRLLEKEDFPFLYLSINSVGFGVKF